MGLILVQPSIIFGATYGVYHLVRLGTNSNRQAASPKARTHWGHACLSHFSWAANAIQVAMLLIQKYTYIFILPLPTLCGLTPNLYTKNTSRAGVNVVDFTTSLAGLVTACVVHSCLIPWLCRAPREGPGNKWLREIRVPELLVPAYFFLFPVTKKFNIHGQVWWCNTFNPGSQAEAGGFLWV